MTEALLITAIANYIDYYNNQRLQKETACNDTNENIMSNIQKASIKYRQP